MSHVLDRPAFAAGAGFTLWETVLAIGLFAVAAVGVATAMKTAGDLAWEVSVAEGEVRASRAVLEEVLARRGSPAGGPPGSRIEMEDGTVASWTSEPADLYSADGRSLEGLVRLVVEITPPDKPVETYELIVHEGS